MKYPKQKSGFSNLPEKELERIATQKNRKGVATQAALEAQRELYQESWSYYKSDTNVYYD